MTWYNNNIDLFARIADQRYLIEAKSLNDVRDSVNRMRYGIGQLADYSYRYRDELEDAQKVLAFGQRVTPEVSWIANVLDQERTAFVYVGGETIAPLNSAAANLAFLK